jgi:hypothetical protein
MTAEQIILTILGIGQGYLILGAVFALVFVTVLGPRLDPAVRGSSIGFRLVIIPSIALLWPLLYLRWVQERSVPTECNAHRNSARGEQATSATAEAQGQ